MDQANRQSWQPVLLTMLSVAFAAWAGAVVWMGNSISDQLARIQDGMLRVEREMVDFKLEVSQRVTRIEVRHGDEERPAR